MSAGSVPASGLNERRLTCTIFPCRYPPSTAHLSLSGTIIHIYSEQCGHTQLSLSPLETQAVTSIFFFFFFAHLADVFIRESLCFVLLFIFHVNIGVQGASETSEMHAALFIKPVKQTFLTRLMRPSIKTGA